MHPQDVRMSGHRKGLRTMKWHFLLVIWILMLTNPQRNALGYFLGDIKAVLNGCEDHWTLQDKAAFPLLYRMTVCVNIRVVAPRPWIAFTYSSVHGLMPELGLEGDGGALYAWLLRVKHRFPLQLSQQDWHQVCLRRDVVGSSFSLEVDGLTVGHRVVIAQAIPSYGSLWLGCGQREQPVGGHVELYLFRVWADLQQHLPCEDGSVIGWSSDYWGVTSANARQRDDSLPCATPVTTVPSSVLTPTPDPSAELICHTDQLCSNDNAYFWMPVSVHKQEEIQSEKEIHNFMSSVFSCEGQGNVTATTRSDFDILCLDVNYLQVENVSCVIKANRSESQCGVLLHLSPIVSACKLHQAGLSALQQTTGKHLEATLTGNVERVVWDLCDGVDSSSGGYVTCSSSLSLEEMCNSNAHSTLNCAILTSDHILNKPQNATPNSCTSEETHYCNCTSFCNNQNHFYAQWLNVSSVSIDTKSLQNMLTSQVIQTCGVRPNLECNRALDVLKKQGLWKTYVNCQNIDQKSYSCMMILEMTEPITDCSVITVLQTLINSTVNVTTDGPLTHMVVCGDPAEPIRTMLTSNLTWFPSNLRKGDVCEKSQTRLKCAANENLAVLLSDTCPSQETTTSPPIKTTVVPLSTTMTQTTTTQPRPTIPRISLPPTTLTTAALPTTIAQTSSSNLHRTAAKITNTHNTEATTQRSTLPEPSSLRTTTLSVPPATDALVNSETTTSLITTQKPTKNTDDITSSTLASTTTEASNPTTANLMTTSIATAAISQALPTTSLTTAAVITDHTTNANTIDSTTASTMADLEDTSTSNTASTTATNSIDSTTTQITMEKATTSSITVGNAVTTPGTANTMDSSNEANVARSTTPNSAFNSATSSNVDTTGSDSVSTSTAASTVDGTAEVTVSGAPLTESIYSTTPASTATKTTSHATTITSVADDTTEVSSTTASDKVYNTHQTSSSQAMINSASPTSGTTVATLPTITSKLPPTTRLKTASTSEETTLNPFTSVGTGSQLSTTFTDTVPTTKATPISSTQTPDTTGSSLHDTTNGETTTDAYGSIPITAETTQVTTTSAPYSDSKTTLSTVEATSLSDSTIENSDTTQQAAADPSTTETSAQPTSTGSGQTRETITMTTSPYPTSLTTMAASASSTNPSSKETQSSTTPMLPSSTTEYSVTTSNTPDTTKYDVTMSDATTVTTATTTSGTTHSETNYVTMTSMPLLSTTKSSKGTTVDSINTTIAQGTTTAAHDTAAVTLKPDTTIAAFESTMASTQTSKSASNITSHLTTSTATGLIETSRPTTTGTPTSIQTTSSTVKPTGSLTAEVTTPGAVPSSLPTTTPTATPIYPATALPITTTSTTISSQPTHGMTATTPEASRTTLQTATTLVTPTSDNTTGSQQDLEDEANNLLSQTEDVSRLNSSQVSKLVGQLERLLDGPTVSKAVAKQAINIISNLMEGNAQALSASANRLVRLVDELGIKLEVIGENEILSAPSLVQAVKAVDGKEFSAITVNIFNTDNVQFGASGVKSSGAPLGSVFLPSSLTERLSPEERQQANRVQFTFYTKSTLFQDATLNNETLVSPVLASSVANLSLTNLRENIQFTIRNIKPIKMNHSTLCVFWDFTENGGDGGWSNVGCNVVSAPLNQTTCSCNHLTAFAVLMDFSREGIPDRQHAQILSFITYIGCGVSAVFLSITILTYLSFEKLLRDIPAKILVQLCISLLLLNLVFMLDGWLALYKVNGLCISTAFFLHYFLLTSFTWAGLEALHMYLSIVRVFTPYLSKYMMKFSIMGWGIPVIVVVITIAVDKDNYGLVSYGNYTDGTADDFCWLRNNTAFYVGVVAYFLLMFILCLIVFIVVLVQLARIKRQNPQNQSPNRGVLSDLRSISGLIILLGLTWGFAFFAWEPLYLPFVYLFSIFNSLQGFFIFVFHCALKENVQRQWRTYLCCGRLRLPENSDWSRTATHNTKNTSFTMMSSSAAHLTSSPSYAISESNSSGSAYADSGISDVSTSDVVLNEIHRRNMSLQGHL